MLLSVRPSPVVIYNSCLDCQRRLEHDLCVCSMVPLPPLPPPIPPPVPVETHPNRAGGLKPPIQPRVVPDPNRLAPEDAYYAPSIPRSRPPPTNYDGNLRTLNGNVSASAAVAALRPPPAVPGADLRKARGTSRRRRRKGAWKKLLWVKQSCKKIRVCC